VDEFRPQEAQALSRICTSFLGIRRQGELSREELRTCCLNIAAGQGTLPPSLTMDMDSPDTPLTPMMLGGVPLPTSVPPPPASAPVLSDGHSPLRLGLSLDRVGGAWGREDNGHVGFGMDMDMPAHQLGLSCHIAAGLPGDLDDMDYIGYGGSMASADSGYPKISAATAKAGGWKHKGQKATRGLKIHPKVTPVRLQAPSGAKSSEESGPSVPVHMPLFTINERALSAGASSQSQSLTEPVGQVGQVGQVAQVMPPLPSTVIQISAAVSGIPVVPITGMQEYGTMPQFDKTVNAMQAIPFADCGRVGRDPGPCPQPGSGTPGARPVPEALGTPGPVNDAQWRCSVKNSFLHVEYSDNSDGGSNADGDDCHDGGSSQRSSSVPSRLDRDDYLEEFQKRHPEIGQGELQKKNKDNWTRHHPDLSQLDFDWGMPRSMLAGKGRGKAGAMYPGMASCSHEGMGPHF